MGMVMRFENEHPTHGIAVRALRKVARANGLPYAVVKERFVENHPGITVQFWREIKASNGSRFESVYYCDGCGRFDLE